MAEDKKLQEDCEAEKIVATTEEVNEEITATEDKEAVAEEAVAEEAVAEETVAEEAVAEAVQEVATEEKEEKEEKEETAQPEAVQTETVAVAKPKKECNKKRIIAVVAFVLVFALIFSMAGMNTANQGYGTEIEETSIELIVQTYTALTVVGTRLEYWDDAGANNALIDEAYLEILAELEAGMEDMESAFSDLKNPPSAYEEQYTYLSNMYEAYLISIDLAINYGTDLEVYFEEYQAVAEVFIENYTAISEYYFASEETETVEEETGTVEAA
ncbi:MAG: hypothetical protein R3Y32_02165 [Bacillota bacterium]